jgi:hypothetical protein
MNRLSKEQRTKILAELVEQGSQTKDRGKRPSEVGHESPRLSPLPANATLRLPPEEEAKVLQVEILKLQAEKLRKELDQRVGGTTSTQSAPQAKSPWYTASPEVLQRRQIVLRNSKMSSESLCKVFDSERISLPTGWEEKHSVTTWTQAFETADLKQNIHKIISTDRTKSTT